MIFLCMVFGACSEPSGRSDGAAARARGVSDTDKKELELASMTSGEGRPSDVGIERLLELEVSSRDMSGFATRVRELRRKVLGDRPEMLSVLVEQVARRTAEEARRVDGDLGAACRVYDDGIAWMREAIESRVSFSRDDFDISFEKNPLEGIYQEMIKASDDYAKRWSETEVARKSRFRDMLVESEQKEWGPIGSELTAICDAGILKLESKPGVHDRSSMICALNGSSGGRRDFELAFEFEIRRGGFDVLLRYCDGRDYDSCYASYRVGDVDLDKTYKASIFVVGSRVDTRMSSKSTGGNDFDWRHPRVGGIGIRLHEQSSIVIKSLLLRVIRP